MVDREKLRKENLEMFEAMLPNIYMDLKNFEPASELRFDDNGDPDVWFDGQYYYENKSVEISETQLKNFWKSPTRTIIHPPNPSGLDDYAGPALNKILYRAAEMDISYHQNFTSFDAFTVTVLGIGLGQFIDEIVEQTQCRCMVFLDVNYEFLYHSLEIYDWQKLDEILTSRGGHLRFCIDTSPENLSAYMRYFVRGTNVGGMDGLTIYQHQKNSILDETREVMVKDINLIGSSLGFFYDETLMIKNCHENFSNGKARYYYRQNKTFPAEIPVFVVGSGPSLDSCLPIIKANADRAYIISAGTSLRPLVVNGIIPDMHLEQENLNVDLTVGQVAEKYDISSVLYLAASSVDPLATKHFKDVLYYSRKSLSPFPIFFDDLSVTLERPHNTVVNAAFSFVQELGFRDFYFFGVDCGTINQEQHHSKDAYQYTEGALHVDQTFNVPVTSNFGGDFFTSPGLHESLDYLETAIKEKGRGRRYYNCSDGAYLTGARPLLPENVNIPEFKHDKHEILQEIYKEMPIFSEEDFEKYWDEIKLEEAINWALDEISDVYENTETLSDEMYMVDITSIIAFESSGVPDRMRRGALVLLRGTFLQMIIAVSYYAKRVTEPEKMEAYTQIVKEEMLDMIEILREVAIEEVCGLNEKAA